MKTGDALWAPPDPHHLVNFSITLLLLIHANVVFLSFFTVLFFFKLKLLKPFHIVADFGIGQLVVGEFAADVLVVGTHINQSVAGEVEEDGACHAFFFTLEGFLNGGCDGVR